MKIITPGRTQKGWGTEATCTGHGNGGGGCGAVLFVDESDLFKTSQRDYLGDGDDFATFACVSCGVLTDLSKNVPRDLIDRLGKRNMLLHPGKSNDDATT